MDKLRIFLVEDEFVVREGIKKIDWESHGYEFCGEAPDGEMAIPMIRKEKPDVVITDIKMPFMDGLELTRQVKKELPYTEIVILSGYEEFGYAKEAVSLGVSQYLTKPISAAELLKELDELKESIDKKRIEREIAQRYLNDIAEDTRKNRQDFFNELIEGSSSVSKLMERAEEIGIGLAASAYCILLVTSSADGNDESYPEPDRRVNDRLHEWAVSNTDRFLMFDRNMDGQAVLFKGEDEDTLAQTIDEACDEFKKIISGYDNVRYYAGIGCTVRRLSELNRSYEAASAAFAHRYFDPSNRIVKYNDDLSTLSRDIAGDTGEVEFSAMEVSKPDREGLLHYLKTGDISELEYFVDEFLNKAGRSALESLLFRQYVSMDMYFTVVEFIKGLGQDKSAVTAPDGAMSVAQSPEAVRDYLKKLITEAIDLRNSISHSRYQDVVDSVIKYIEEHFADEELSLNVLAEYVRFSPNHLSMIFSQHMGETFSRYLIDYRIGKAKEALKCTSKKSSEIAVEVGYRDPHYFSYMFKKVTGMTPTQYREGK